MKKLFVYSLLALFICPKLYSMDFIKNNYDPIKFVILGIGIESAFRSSVLFTKHIYSYPTNQLIKDEYEKLDDDAKIRFLNHYSVTNAGDYVRFARNSQVKSLVTGLSGLALFGCLHYFPIIYSKYR